MRTVLVIIELKFGKTKGLNVFKEITSGLDAFPIFFPKKLVIENVRDLIDDCFIFFASI